MVYTNINVQTQHCEGVLRSRGRVPLYVSFGTRRRCVVTFKIRYIPVPTAEEVGCLQDRSGG